MNVEGKYGNVELDDRNVQIAKLRASGMTLKEIGIKFGISTERVRQIELRYLRRAHGRTLRTVISPEDTRENIFYGLWYNFDHNGFMGVSFDAPMEEYDHRQWGANESGYWPKEMVIWLEYPPRTRLRIR